MRLQTRSLVLGCALLALALAAAPGSAATPADPVRHPHAAPPLKPRLKPVAPPLSVDDTGPAESPPDNDACAGAITIECGNISLSGNTYAATNDYDFSDTTTSCTQYSASGRDVVYKLDAVPGDSLWVRYQSSADASIYLVTDCADVQHSCVAGADLNHQNQVENLYYGFKQAGTYYLVLDSYGPDTYGTWTLVGQFRSCGLAPPANDVCETATAIYCGPFYASGNTVAANDDYSFPTAAGACTNPSKADGRDVVYTMSVNAGDSLSVNYTSTADGVIYVMPDCPLSGTPINCVVGANAAGPGATETLNFRFAYTGTYYLVLDSDGPTDGAWTMVGSLTCAVNVPTNDVCANATLLVCGPYSMSGNNALAAPDYDPTDAGCTDFAEPGPDVVYRIDASAGDSVWCDYGFPHVNGQTDIDGSVYLVTDCSNVASSCVAGADQSGAGQIEHLRYKFTAPGTYYLIFDAYDLGVSGDWTATGEVLCPQGLAVGDRAGGALQLAAAAPNPFVARSTLRFTLPVRSRASLAIVDIAGRVVRTLLDAELPAGAQSVTWDGRDDRGARVGGGTYFARLRAGDRVASRTLVFLR